MGGGSGDSAGSVKPGHFVGGVQDSRSRSNDGGGDPAGTGVELAGEPGGMHAASDTRAAIMATPGTNVLERRIRSRMDGA